MNEKSIKANDQNIAFCGLYCEACRGFIKGKCKGCAGNEKATWCQIRTCCMEKGYRSCADCKEITDLTQCKKYNNPVARIIGFVFRTDRAACVDYIRLNGYPAYARYMAELGKMSMPRK